MASGPWKAGEGSTQAGWSGKGIQGLRAAAGWRREARTEESPPGEARTALDKPLSASSTRPGRWTRAIRATRAPS